MSSESESGLEGGKGELLMWRAKVFTPRALPQKSDAKLNEV